MEPVLHIALMNPEIGPNAGNIGRLCLGIGARLHLVHPLGFDTNDKAVRRAGLDYWKHVDVVEHDDAGAFWRWTEGRRVHLLSTKATRSYAQPEWQSGDVLVFGPESRGLDEALFDEFPVFQIPMTGPIRSLNLSNAVAVVAYAALQRITPDLF
ncbi:MAG: tRNA (cytidine(34)-2'-O)-methyltransferase [Myxococcota bacterium]|nr:tRNA (cytidine(34)-2'-O)-methyltransferase [Myxococcota bacterium]